MIRFPTCLPYVFCLAAAAATGGCAMGALSQGGLPGGETSPLQTAATTSAAGNYTLSAEESELDCKKLAGKVQLRILEVRSGMKPEEASSIAKALQSTEALFGGSTQGLNATAEHQRMVAQLAAYNKQLADKDCRSFDIAKALTSTDAVPSPTIPPKSSTH